MATHTAHPLWYRIHSATANVVELTATTIAYAKEYAAAAIAQRAKDKDELQQRPRRFKEVRGAANTTNNDAMDDDSVGTGIITFKWVNAKTGVVCCFGTDDKNRLKYKFPIYWKGMMFRSAGRGGPPVPFSTILNTK